MQTNFITKNKNVRIKSLTGNILSHHSMKAFFSGTDLATLREEGNERNCFVSLIVNNDGNYCAAVTRKVKTVSEVTVKKTQSSYEFFGEGKVEDSNPTVTTESCQEEVIEYFKLDIEKPVLTNHLSYLDQRFEDIQKKKEAEKPIIFPNPSFRKVESDTPFRSYLHNDEEPTFPWYNSIPKEEKAKTVGSKTEIPHVVTDTQINEAVCHMLTCSLTLKTDTFDLDTWVTKHMDNVYKRIFSGESSNYPTCFEDWAEFIVQFTIDKLFSTVPYKEGMDEDVVISQIAELLIDALSDYYDSHYVETYCTVLERYII